MTNTDYEPKRKSWAERALGWTIAALFLAFGLWGLYDLYKTLNAAPHWANDLALIFIVGQYVIWRLGEQRLSRIERGIAAVEWRVSAVYERQPSRH
jgi:hypothetical protein